MSKKFSKLVESAKIIVIVQADNPDGDSLASSLALEHIFGDMGKKVIMYCGVEIPSYLRYMEGWDRVNKELPNLFDLSIIIDTSAISLLETLQKNDQLSWLKAKSSVVLDHHSTKATIDFVDEIICEPAVSCGELIYSLAQTNKWPLSLEASEFLAISILSDSLGLMSESTTGESIRIIADLVDAGVSLTKLDDSRKSLQKKSPEILAYKGALLARVNYSSDLSIAFIDIPWNEIETYSHQYNPAMLVLDEMRMVQGVRVAVAFKSYPDGKITGKIRCNYGYAIADKLAEHFGGGGHPYAAGFKINDDRKVKDLYDECTNVAIGLLKEVKPL